MTLVVDSSLPRQKCRSRSRRRYHHKGARRARGDLVIDAAIELIDAGGFDALTMRALAQRVGISRALLYTMFEDRDALKLAVSLQLEQRFVANLQRVTANLSRVLQIQHAFRAHSDWWNHSRAYRELCSTAIFAHKPRDETRDGSILFKAHCAVA